MKKKLLFIGSAVVLIVVGFLVYKSFGSTDKTISFETAKISNTDLRMGAFIMAIESIEQNQSNNTLL